MASLLRMGVPVATPVQLGDYFTAANALIGHTKHDRLLEDDIAALLRVPFVRTTNSARSALYLTLDAIKRDSQRDEVVVPAFVCPSVGRAVVKAGLKPVLCDVGFSGSGLDAKSLEKALSRNTLAVVVAHLFGYPVEIRPAMEMAHSAGAIMIEDCAQAFGATLRRRYVGTVADVGIFSFGLSKVLWSMGGGLIATSNAELVNKIDQTGLCTDTDGLGEIADVAKYALLGTVLRSSYLGPLNVVWKALRGKDDCTDFKLTALPSSHAAVARSLLRRFAEITCARRQNALHLSDALAGLDGIDLPAPERDAGPVFLRLPVIVRDPSARTELIERLRRVGVNASEMYSRDSYEAMQAFAARASKCPRAKYLSARMLNLPTHSYVRQRDLDATVAVFESVLSTTQLATKKSPTLVSVH